MNPPIQKNQKGSLLMIVLWMVALLSILAVSLSYRVGLKVKATEFSISRFGTTYAARAAVAQAITVIKKDPTLDVDTLQDIWANNPAEFKEILVGKNQFSVEVEENGQIRYGLTDEESKVNLNTFPQEVLENLFAQLEIDPDLVANLMDWIDSDDDDRNHGRGAEKEYYEHLKAPYSPKNAPLENMEELLLVKGLTPAIVEKLRERATVYGSGKINLNTAPAETFKVLGFEDEFTAKVAQFRLGKDSLPGTEDDGVAYSPSSFISELSVKQGLEGKEKILLNKFQNYFRVTSTAFRLRAKALSALGSEKELSAILSIKKGKDVEVVFWHENKEHPRPPARRQSD